MRNVIAAVVATACVVGCANNNGGPLVFVVTHTVGIDIQATSTTAATPGLTVGYKSVDIAVVPTQTSRDGGAPLRGCYAVGKNADAPATCSAGTDSGSESDDATKVKNKHAKYAPRDGNRSRDLYIPAVLAVSPDDPTTLAAPPSDTNENGTNPFSESVIDAYSVYASFGVNAKGGGSGVGAGIGEVFATGDAAVQLAEGVNYYSSREGNADILRAKDHPTCVEQLTAAKTAGVDMSKIPACTGIIASTAPPATNGAAAPPADAAPANNAPPPAGNVGPAPAKPPAVAPTQIPHN